MSEELAPCPFCGKKADLEDHDTLYPSGTGWKFDEELGCRTYHRAHDVPVDQWVYSMHCPVQAGGCGAEVQGDTRDEALNSWNKRSNKELTDLRARCEAYEYAIKEAKSALANITQYVAANGDTWPADRAFLALEAIVAIAKERT